MGKIVIDLPQSRHAVSVNFNLPRGQTDFRTHLSFPFDVDVCKRERGEKKNFTSNGFKREGFQSPFIVQALESS